MQLYPLILRKTLTLALAPVMSACLSAAGNRLSTPELQQLQKHQGGRRSFAVGIVCDSAGKRPCTRPELRTDSHGCVIDMAMLRDGTTYVLKATKPTVPVSFSRVEKKDDDDYHLGATLNLGYGITWLRGTGVYEEPESKNPNSLDSVKAAIAKGSLNVSTIWYWGIAANTGVRDGGQDVGGSLGLSIFAGLHDFGLTLGYDLLGKTPFVGLGGKIDVFQMKRGNGSDICVEREAF